MALDLDRSAIRSAGRTARRSITGDARTIAEAALIEHLSSLLSLQRSSTPTVGVFIAHDGEPDLHPLVDRLWRRDITVALPVLRDDPDDYTMRFTPWHVADTLRPGRYGIPIPPDREPLEPDLLLVSFVGFDDVGHRIGRGGGFFDRYLAATKSTVVGVGFEAQRFARIPVEPHDMSLPTVVTDLGVRFNEVAA